MPTVALTTSRPRVTIRAEVDVLNSSITGASKYSWDVPELRDNQRWALLHLSNPDRPHVLLLVEAMLLGETHDRFSSQVTQK